MLFICDIFFYFLKAIHGYRETERLKWNPANTETLNRVRQIAFPEGVAQLKHVHVLDLAEKGWIKPHIDAVRVTYTICFCKLKLYLFFSSFVEIPLLVLAY